MNYQEIGTSGLKQYSGFVEEAYATELRWPSVQPLYSRLRRSDPEISTVRTVFTALARACSIDWQLPDKPSDVEKEAAEFAQEATGDIAGGPGGLLETIAAHVPFMGWGWWEVVPGMRDPKWVPPGGDPWRSEYDDGRIGIRKIAWRDSSSLSSWSFGDNGRLLGMNQSDFPNPDVFLPLENSLHITFGDSNNPEGLSPLEAVWRLERLKYGFEVVQGIGFEHTAGILKIKAEQGLNPNDKAEVQRVARAAMTAQEGNYVALPKGIDAEFMDVNFSAAGSILETIRYYGLLKLQVYLSQWVAIASTAGTGAYSAASDASSMFMLIFNSMMEGFGKQIDDQVGRRLFQWNDFPGLERRPKLVISPIEKQIGLGELASLLGPIKNAMPLGDEDFIAIRKRTGFLPETLPEIVSAPAPQPAPEEEESEPEEDRPPEESEEEGEVSEQAIALAERQAYWNRYLLQHPDAANG